MGETYAYFSDQVVSNNTLSAGTLDFAMHPTTSLNLDNLKLLDKIFKKFNVKNIGTLDIKVQFLWDWNPAKSPVYETTLAELKSQNPEVTSHKIFLSK